MRFRVVHLVFVRFVRTGLVRTRSFLDVLLLGRNVCGAKLHEAVRTKVRGKRR